MAGSVPAELVALANRLADAARPIAARYFRTGVTVDDKSDAAPSPSPTARPRRRCARCSTEHVPEHGVFGEEHGAVRTDADYVWVLDPIDGTKAFITGLPIFGTLIALLHRGVPVLGVIDQPILEERWLGVAGQHSTFNGQPIQVRACPTLDRAYMYSTAPIMFPGAFEKRHEALTQQVKLFRWGGDCYAYGLLASGHVDLVVENSPQALRLRRPRAGDHGRRRPDHRLAGQGARHPLRRLGAGGGRSRRSHRAGHRTILAGARSDEPEKAPSRSG